MEENKAIIRRYYNEVINRRHLAVPDEMLAPTFEGFKTEGADRANSSILTPWACCNSSALFLCQDRLDGTLPWQLVAKRCSPILSPQWIEMRTMRRARTSCPG